MRCAADFDIIDRKLVRLNFRVKYLFMASNQEHRPRLVSGGGSNTARHCASIDLHALRAVSGQETAQIGQARVRGGFLRREVRSRGVTGDPAGDARGHAGDNRMSGAIYDEGCEPGATGRFLRAILASPVLAV